jgi:Lrp/AsnC family transcriptional regulator for asnA, asnC and gidA
MAKENNITISSVKSRYDNLKKSGVINGVIMMVNPEKIGFTCYGFLGFKVCPENIKELHVFLNRQTYCLATWNRLQEINLGCYFALPDFRDLTKILDQLKTHSYIKEVQPLINVGTPIDMHPENLIIKKNTDPSQQTVFKEDFHLNLEEESKKGLQKSYIETSQLRKMKKGEREIAKILCQNARTSFTNMAKQLNMSTANVSRIYKKLRKNGYLLRCSITVNLKKLGYQANLMIFIKTATGTNISNIQKELLKQSNVIALNKTLGDWDIFATIPIASFEDFFRIGQQFRKIKGIKTMQFDLNPPFSRWPSHLFHNLL